MSGLPDERRTAGHGLDLRRLRRAPATPPHYTMRNLSRLVPLAIVLSRMVNVVTCFIPGGCLPDQLIPTPPGKQSGQDEVGHTGVWEKHTPPDKNSLGGLSAFEKIRGWFVVSAAVLQGNGSRKINSCSTDTGSIGRHSKSGRSLWPGGFHPSTYNETLD